MVMGFVGTFEPGFDGVAYHWVQKKYRHYEIANSTKCY